MQMGSLAQLVQMLAERSPDTALAAMILTEQRRYPIIRLQPAHGHTLRAHRPPPRLGRSASHQPGAAAP